MCQVLGGGGLSRQLTTISLPSPDAHHPWVRLSATLQSLPQLTFVSPALLLHRLGCERECSSLFIAPPCPHLGKMSLEARLED